MVAYLDGLDEEAEVGPGDRAIVAEHQGLEPALERLDARARVQVRRRGLDVGGVSECALQIGATLAELRDTFTAVAGVERALLERELPSVDPTLDLGQLPLQPRTILGRLLARARGSLAELDQ